MKIIIPNKIGERLFTVINEAGDNEIGGILMGKFVSDNVYRIVDFTTQSTRGTVVSFIRIITEIIKPLKKFFKKTKKNYKKYNYLGEWHSHPNFIVQPSNKDMESMWDIVEDLDTNANFAALLIFRTNLNSNQLEGSATIFLPEHKFIEGEIVKEKSYE